MTLAQGDKVAWVFKSGGKTSGVSAIHRVFENGTTYCSLPIPEEELRFDPRVMHTLALNVCSRCRAMADRAELVGA